MTGTISTAMPASTQSIRFWQESSLYRKLPVAVIVKIDIGRAMRSARSRRKSCIISTIRGTPCSVNAPDTTGLFELVRVMYSRHASETCGLDVVVGRERRGEVRDVGEPVGEPDVLDEVGRVRQARLAGPVVEDLEPATSRARNGPGRRRGRRAARRRGRTGRTSPARTRSPPRRRRAGTGPARRRVERQAVLEQPPAHLGPADLHADLGQHAHRLVDDPAR